MTVTADDTESTKLSRRHRGSGGVSATPTRRAALPPPRVPYERHPQQPGDGGHTPALTYTRVSNFVSFLTSKVDLYVDRLIREYIR